MKCAVAVFAKTPGLSPVKTRLAASIGEEKATEFYELSVASIEAVMTNLQMQNEAVTVHWTLAEKDAPELPRWRAFPAIWTGEGGLGDRLANVSEVLFKSHDAVMFLGTDSPQLSVKTIFEALAKFEVNSDRAVCGPAFDGGFFLFVSRDIVSREIWEAVTYSDAKTLEDLESRLKDRGIELIRIDPQQDVDTMEDLSTLRDNLRNRENELLPAQRKLLEWLNDYFEVAV
ncbi:MAG: DUF2064 domain-containing protein [Pseudomonadota bacterium]